MKAVSLAATLVGVGLLLLDAANLPCAADDDALVLVYKAEAWDGREPAAADVRAAAAVVAKRCAHAGFDGVVAKALADSGPIEVRLPKAHAAEEAAIRALVERRGDVAFRIRAREKMEDEWRDKRLNAGEPPPKGYAWVPDEQSSLMALVETPEAPIVSKLDELMRPSNPRLDASAVEAARELARVREESVFENADIARASVRRSMSTIGGQSMRHVAVQFEFKEDRKAAFEKFTGANVGRVLCVVVEGKVQTAPVINAAIPGAGLLRAAGSGWTDEQARDLAAVLEAGALPVKLVRAKGDTKLGSAPRSPPHSPSAAASPRRTA
jgi:preprotein translocase subunit SecD